MWIKLVITPDLVMVLAWYFDHYWKSRDTITAWKVSKYGDFSGPYFAVFGLNMEIYRVNLRIHSKYRKVQTRKNYVFGQFSCSWWCQESLTRLHVVIYHVIAILWIYNLFGTIWKPDFKYMVQTSNFFINTNLSLNKNN